MTLKIWVDFITKEWQIWYTEKEHLSKRQSVDVFRLFLLKKRCLNNFFDLVLFLKIFFTFQYQQEHNKMINLVQWGGGITGHPLFTPVMTQKIEVFRFKIYQINILAELVYLISFRLFVLFKTYWGRRYLALKCAVTSFSANQGPTVP